MRPEIRADVFKDSRELYCDGTDGSSVGPDGRVTGLPVVDPDEAAHLCAMCGGEKVLLWTPLPGHVLPGVSADERRFFQSAPFESEEHKRYAELVIALLQPSPLAPLDAQLPNRTMMSWSAGIIIIIYIYIYIYTYISFIYIYIYIYSCLKRPACADGSLACVGFEQAPSAQNALKLLGFKLPEAAQGVGVCGLNSAKQLAVPLCC
jgi:hypothetical protein